MSKINKKNIKKKTYLGPNDASNASFGPKKHIFPQTTRWTRRLGPFGVSMGRADGRSWWVGHVGVVDRVGRVGGEVAVWGWLWPFGGGSGRGGPR
jgi:hypothetical protein